MKLDKLKSLFNVLIQSWNPDSVVLVSQELKKMLGTVNEIGWLTYTKELTQDLKISNKVIFEKFNTGNLFYLNLENNGSHDYSLTSELKSLKRVIK